MNICGIIWVFLRNPIVGDLILLIFVNIEETMANYSTTDFKPGLKFIQDGEPCVIVENEFVKPGKGQAFTRTKIRKLISGKVLEINFKSGSTVEAADVVDYKYTY